MGTGSDWLPIIAAISSRWWYSWTLYASQHSSNGKSASRLLEVGCRGHELFSGNLNETSHPDCRATHECPIPVSAIADAVSLTSALRL